MIASDDRCVVVSSLGWVDHDALWVFGPDGDAARVVSLESGARWLSLHEGDGRRFSVTHHYDGERVRITVHDFREPERVIAAADLGQEGSSLTGDGDAWASVPKLYVDYLGFGAMDFFALLTVLPRWGRVEVGQFNWYGDDYDKGYQGVTGVCEVPGEEFALVSVQRSSKLVMHELSTGDSQGSIELGANGFGNPRPVLRSDRRELWADNYDSLVVVDTRTWDVVRHRSLQSPSGGSQLFIGGFALTADGHRCTVARPFSGDAVVLDTASLKTVGRVTLGAQPLEAVLLADDLVVGRDWQTGKLLLGRVQRRRFGR